MQQAAKEESFDRTLVDLPPGSKFASVDYDILMHGNIVATARSKTMARRIANALNDYLPNSNGR